MHAFRKQAQKGFTLIELIITIVIIGILAAVAIPKFVNLSGDAQSGVAAGVGAALASASSVNYSKSLVPGATACTGGVVTGCYFSPMTTCAQLQAAASSLIDLPTGYTVVANVAVGAAPALLATGVSTNACAVQYGGALAQVQFNAYGA